MRNYLPREGSIRPSQHSKLLWWSGNVWVKLSSVANATTADWLILDMESEVVGIAVLPINVTLKVIRNGRAYGTEQLDGEDIMVVVYEIE